MFWNTLEEEFFLISQSSSSNTVEGKKVDGLLMIEGKWN